jgi:hypothetical protein
MRNGMPLEPHTLRIQAERDTQGITVIYTVSREDDLPGTLALAEVLKHVPKAKAINPLTWTVPVRATRYLVAAISTWYGGHATVASDEDTALELGLPFPNPDVPNSRTWPITKAALDLTRNISPSNQPDQESRVFIDAINAELIEFVSEQVSARKQLELYKSTEFGRRCLASKYLVTKTNRRPLSPHHYSPSKAEMDAEDAMYRADQKRHKMLQEPGYLIWDAEFGAHLLQSEIVSSGSSLEAFINGRWLKVRYELGDHRAGIGLLYQNRRRLTADANQTLLRWPKDHW